MKTSVATFILAIALTALHSVFFWLCIPLCLAYFIFSLGLFFRGEIGKGFLVGFMIPMLPIFSLVVASLTHS